jgi:hypothetical protein
MAQVMREPCGGTILMTPQEIRSVRNKAAEYAKGFLSDKYWEEYTELYQAYCINRGVNVNKSRKIRPIDERLVKKETND